MTQLSRIELSTQLKVDLAVSALALQGSYGAVSHLAETFEVSRPTVYAARDTAAELLGQHFDSEEPPGQQKVVVVDEAQLRRAIVALRVKAPNALRPIEELLPILYPGLRVSYGKIQGILAEAEERAKLFNQQVDLSAIVAAALDEMYSQGAPVLAGVDLVSGFLFTLALKKSRSGDDWAAVLNDAKEQHLALKTVVKDAAKGIAAGVNEVYPKAEQRDDCFHAQYEMGKVLFYLERKAYAAIAKVEEVRKDIEKCRRTGRGNRTTLTGQLKAATWRCNEALALHDRYEQLMRRAQEALEHVDLLSGELREPGWMQTEIEQTAGEIMALNEKKCRKVGRYLQGRAAGLASYVKELNEHLALLSSVSDPSLVKQACVILRLLSDLEHHRRPWRKFEDRRRLLASYARLCAEAGEEAGDLLSRVELLLWLRHRASSAIEGFNAALRPHLYVHKGVTQEFLELFQAAYNLRRRRFGRHKGRSPYEVLTGEPVSDWLTMLGYPPSSSVN
jgi:hypothetical protein